MMRFINLKTMQQEDDIPSVSVLCLGNFDGVHIGHRQLVEAVIHKRESLRNQYSDISAGAWFFDSASYKQADEIYSLEEKLCVFSELGLDYAVIADFNEIKSYPPDRFVQEVLNTECNCIHAVCGENFRFGYMASGNCEMLRDLMQGDATVIPLFSINTDEEDGSDKIVSSTYIRSLLCSGDIETANSLLSKNYSITETVLHGKALGRTIGIPTINQLPTDKKILLKNGIYATVCTVNENKYYGVTNVGIRPTFDEDRVKNIETHIIDYSGDCYNSKVKVEFIKRIRDEMKFYSIDELKLQIESDVKFTKQFFALK